MAPERLTPARDQIASILVDHRIKYAVGVNDVVHIGPGFTDETYVVDYPWGRMTVNADRVSDVERIEVAPMTEFRQVVRFYFEQDDPSTGPLWTDRIDVVIRGHQIDDAQVYDLGMYLAEQVYGSAAWWGRVVIPHTLADEMVELAQSSFDRLAGD